MKAAELKKNNWFNQMDISNIGGILGLRYNTSLYDTHDELTYSLWSGISVKPAQYYLNINPMENQNAWFNDETSYYQPSSLDFGEKPPLFKDTSQNNYYLLLTSNVNGTLNFTLSTL